MPSSVLFVIASVIWGSTFWAITLQLGAVPPSVSVVYRFALASLTLFAICVVRGDRLRLPWRAQRWMILQGFLTFGLSYVCTYNAERFVVSALVAVMFALMVFFTPICARIGFGKPIPARTWSAGSAALAGVFLLFYHALANAVVQLKAGGSGYFLVGVLLATLASIASSAGSVVVGKVREEASNLPLTMAWSMLWGTLMVTAYTLLSGQSFALPHELTSRYLAGLGYLAIFGSVVAFYAYFTLIDRIGPQKAVYVTVVTPVISVLLSIKLEHYRPGALEWAGMTLCLASVAWALRAPKAPVINQDNLLEIP
jgi:drug/metabolite transporter (DMT)-like permease